MFTIWLPGGSQSPPAVEGRHRELTASGNCRPLLAVHHVEMIAVKPTFAAYSTIDSAVVYETEDSDFADSAIDALKKDSP